jgi:hypothetical protein
MFDSDLFASWPSVLAGALFFSILFSLVGILSELVLDGELRFSGQSISLSLLAFTGYLGVAAAIRRRGNPDR